MHSPDTHCIILYAIYSQQLRLIRNLRNRTTHGSSSLCNYISFEFGILTIKLRYKSSGSLFKKEALI
jgi:hypothetical protein